MAVGSLTPDPIQERLEDEDIFSFDEELVQLRDAAIRQKRYRPYFKCLEEYNGDIRKLFKETEEMQEKVNSVTDVGVSQLLDLKDNIILKSRRIQFKEEKHYVYDSERSDCTSVESSSHGLKKIFKFWNRRGKKEIVIISQTSKCFGHNTCLLYTSRCV